MNSAAKVEDGLDDLPKGENERGIGHNSGVDFSREIITPEQAKAYLETTDEGYDPDRKRPVTEIRSIASYAEAMRSEGWIYNAMPIIFDEEGRLIDGKLRLEACIQADIPFETAVARNVRRDTLHTIDQHRRRSYTGVLESRGVRNAGSVMRTMSKLIRIENGILGKQNLPISWSRYDRVLSANPEITEAVDAAEGLRGCSLHSTPRPVLIFMALKAGLRREIGHFMRALYDPESFPATHPGVMLSNQFETLRDQGVTIDVDKALAMGILALNDFLAGKEVRRGYSWEPNYGEAKVDKGSVTNWKLVRETAPANLGLPRVNGYPGLAEGIFDIRKDADDFAGRMADSIREGIDKDEHQSSPKTILVTPEMAEDWLLRFNTSNRKIQRNHVNMIVRDITAGSWQVNAQPICFTGNPFAKDPEIGVRLLNGQHRLEAIRTAEIPVEIPIATDVPEEAFATYDIHAKRSTVALSDSKADDRVLRAAAKILWKVEQGYPSTYRITPSSTEIMRTIEEHPELAEGFSRARRMKDYATAGVMTYLIYMVMKDQPKIGADFLEGLETGEKLERGNPVIQARSLAIGQRHNRNRSDTLQDLEKAWDDYKRYRGIAVSTESPMMQAPDPDQDDLFSDQPEDEDIDS